MENKRKALGKGLEQLFSSEPMDFSQVEKSIVEHAKETDIVLIPVDQIRSNPYQPREYFDEVALEELASSIKEHGVLQPIIVKKSIKGYELIAGERRTRASKLAGIRTVPAIIKDFTDEEMMDIALLENIQREDLTPIEIAEGFKKYIDRTGITQEEIAIKFGKSRSYITNLLGLLSLPNKVKNLINKGKISQSHARVLSKLEEEEIILSLTDKIIDEDVSVRELEKLASGEKIIKKKPLAKSSFKSAEMSALENSLRDIIGTKVIVSNNKITIPFDSVPDLYRILDIINIKIDEKQDD
ncbi:MAG: ParB/RepB/Spo0J family partition protein [Bacilli bacterium]|nr:ParB/RepB/Spo0J family partition protein [Bacilli bacterium]MDD4795602.1 ParB/RepB/Spo0J family partition protein [Bacilli bacterium]